MTKIRTPGNKEDNSLDDLIKKAGEDRIIKGMLNKPSCDYKENKQKLKTASQRYIKHKFKSRVIRDLTDISYSADGKLLCITKNCIRIYEVDYSKESFKCMHMIKIPDYGEAICSDRTNSTIYFIERKLQFKNKIVKFDWPTKKRSEPLILPFFKEDLDIFDISTNKNNNMMSILTNKSIIQKDLKLKNHEYSRDFDSEIEMIEDSGKNGVYAACKNDDDEFYICRFYGDLFSKKLIKQHESKTLYIKDYINDFAVSNDQSFLALGTTSGIKIVNTKLNEISEYKPSYPVMGIDYSPDNNYIAAIHHNNIAIYEVFPF